MIGEQFFSGESQKKKAPILNPLTDASDLALTPITKNKESASSVLSHPGNITKDSDKEQQVFNRDL